MTPVVYEPGPVYDRCAAKFGPLPFGVILAYGDTIYVPSGIALSPDLIVHEETHLRQQVRVGGPEAWWERYLADDEFRLAQEVEAYRAQLASIPSRPERRRVLRVVAQTLSGSLYGYMVTRAEALALFGGLGV